MAGDSPFSLRGKVVLQCGGSGVLGGALTAVLGAAGAEVVVASRSPALGAEKIDLGSEASILGLRDRILATRGRIDGLVFNSVARTMRQPEEPLAHWEASMATNATGFFALTRAIGDAMADRGAGSIVAISSIQGMVGSNLWLYEEDPAMRPPPDYFFHKAGMINLARYFASHYGARGVRVNTVSPGGIGDPRSAGSPSFARRYRAMTMLGRPAEAGDVAHAALFLLSDAAGYITGANLPVDGGYTAK